MDAESYADVLPWLVFLVVDRRAGLSVGWAGSTAAATAALVVGWAYWRGRRAPIAALAVGTFTACGLAVLPFHSWDSQVDDPRAVVVLALAVALLGSLGVRPMSLAYTAPKVAPAVAVREEYRRVNAQITAAWGVGALAVAASFAVSAVTHDVVGSTFLDWIVPMAVCLATGLWVARRWELFRLEVDAGAGERPGERIASALPLPGWVPRRERDAVVRRLPVGERDTS